MTNSTRTIEQEELATEIAHGLGEPNALPIFRAQVRRYPEEVVLRAYHEALEFPAEKIRKTRGALFNYLLKKYAKES